ncbi:MAG TPA: multicopper oxidase domain-containing protein, partial [Gemmataceae bacterium]
MPDVLRGTAHVRWAKALALAGAVAVGLCAALTREVGARGDGSAAQPGPWAGPSYPRTGKPGSALDVNITPLRFLCPPDGEPLEYEARPSPPVTPFKDPLFIPPVKQPETDPLAPAPVPSAHQRYDEFYPRKFYVNCEQEICWVYHSGSPYNRGTWSWGIDGTTPGPTIIARYGEPILVRRINDLPHPAVSHVKFALPSTSRHLHNAHTASQSDGFPDDWIEPGEYQDHHYANYPSGGDDREKLTTLWYHDHRLDSTAANVYAGLAGAYLLFDENDSGDENDPNPAAWRLPSGKYDIPLVLNDLLFDKRGQLSFNKLNTDGILGDRYCVNRVIQPYLQVERRKYRFRILNAGPSRFYQLYLSSNDQNNQLPHKLHVVTGDGNVLYHPVDANSVYLAVAQRVDVIIDFSEFKPGDKIYLDNRLEQTNGAGPSGRQIFDPRRKNHQHQVMRFDVTDAPTKDNSRIPDTFRPLPPVNLAEVKRERVWEFDHVGGHWTVNGLMMDPNRIDAGIEQDSAEIWTFRNTGNKWHHPIHSHFTEFIILEENGIPVLRDRTQTRPRVHSEIAFRNDSGEIDVFFGGLRRDVAILFPNTEMKIFMRWKDFLGRYVMHC